MSHEEEPPGPEPEDLPAEDLDRMGYLSQLRKAYLLDGRDYYNPFSPFNADEPEDSFTAEPGRPSKAPSIPDGLYQQQNLDPLGLLQPDLDATSLKVHKLKFCEAAPDLIRGVIHALVELSKGDDVELRKRAGDQLAYAARALGLDLSVEKEDLKALHTLAAALTQQMDKSAHLHLDQAKAVAAENHTWPVMLGHRKRQKEKAVEFLKNIELASEHRAKVVNYETAINEYTGQLIDYVDRLRRIEILEKPNTRIRAMPLMPVSDELFKRVQVLEPLDASNGEEWFKVAWDVLLHFTDGQPETFYRLEEFGEYQVDAAKELAKGPRGVETDEKSARSGLKRRMRQSVLTMAKNL